MQQEQERKVTEFIFVINKKRHFYLFMQLFESQGSIVIILAVLAVPLNRIN